MNEDQLEQEALGWLASVGYTPLNARDLDHLDARLARASNREVVLAGSLRAAIDRLNPTVPAAAREDAFKQLPSCYRCRARRCGCLCCLGQVHCARKW